MIISIASGKGGTGKTTIGTNLAMSLDCDAQLLDCDVEEPNAHLFLPPEKTETESITTVIPHIHEDKCTYCGLCEEICQFKAIAVIGKTAIMTFPELCHSCGGCLRVCPENAITEGSRNLGVIESGYCQDVEIVYGRMRVGEAMAPPLIRRVKSRNHPDKVTFVDAPPGTSCPVIATIKDTDFVILVTEPTPFGLHDLKLAVEAVRILDIPHGLIINRSDIGDQKVKEYADIMNIPVLMEIPFDRKIAEAYSNGDLLIREFPAYKKKFQALYEQIVQML